MDGGVYETVVYRGAPGGGPEVDTVAQGIGARQQRPALAVRSGERFLSPGDLPRLQIAVGEPAPGEVLPEVLHRFGADNARQIVADELQQLRLLLFYEGEKFFCVIGWRLKTIYYFCDNP